MCPCVVFSNMSGHVSGGMCVMYCGGHTGGFRPFMHLSTQSPRDCPKPLHHHHHHHQTHPHQLPALPSAWENHTGMSLRDTAAHINKLPPLQVCEEEIMEKGGGGVSARRRLLFLLEATKCVYVFASICVFLSHSSSVSSEYTQ